MILWGILKIDIVKILIFFNRLYVYSLPRRFRSHLSEIKKRNFLDNGSTRMERIFYTHGVYILIKFNMSRLCNPFIIINPKIGIMIADELSTGKKPIGMKNRALATKTE